MFLFFSGIQGFYTSKCDLASKNLISGIGTNQIRTFQKKEMTKVGLENAVSTRELIKIYAGQVDSGYGSQVKDPKQQSGMMGTMVRETYSRNSVISM